MTVTQSSHGILSPNAIQILEKRYLLKNEKGELIETPEQMFRRVAKAVARAELEYGDEKIAEYWENIFFNMMWNLQFCPNSPTLVNAGRGDKGCLSACFCVSPEDTMESIMKVAHDAAMIEKWGGGIGFGFSDLRPKGDSIATTHGKALGVIATMKIYSTIGEAITQGSFRLGAHMGQLRDSHPEIFEFIHVKDNVKHNNVISNFNISVQITDAFIEAVKADSDWDLINPRDKKVWKTIKARQLWKEICESAWKTGDPGIAFIDRVWETQPNPQMGYITTSNPCLASGSLVATPIGWKQVECIKPGDVISTVRGEGIVKTVESHSDYPVFKICLSDGGELRATAAHQFLGCKQETYRKNSKSNKFSMMRLDSLQTGDMIKVQPINMVGTAPSGIPEGWSERDWGLFIGILLGDGCISTANIKRNAVAVAVNSNEPEWISVVSNLMVKAGASSTKLDISKVYGTSAKLWSQSKTGVVATFQKMGIEPSKSPNKRIPLNLQNGSREFLAGLLDGLFSTDGNVNLSGTAPQIRFMTTSRILAQDIRRILLGFGIHGRIYSNKPTESIIRGRKIIGNHMQQTLIIGGEGIRNFVKFIGLSHSDKAARLSKICAEPRLSTRIGNWDARIVSIEPDGADTVYDLYEPNSDTWIAEGYVNRGCGEEWLENYGSCNLASINLYKFVSGNDFDWTALKKTVRNGVRFLDDVVTINQFPLPKLREINLATRRIGLGVMGWADALVVFGIPYDSEQALALAELVGSVINNTAWDESANLAKERGVFPEYENSALKKWNYPPVRNSSVTDVAPTGSISRLTDSSSGIEPYFSLAWHSNILWDTQTSAGHQFVDVPTPIRNLLLTRIVDEDERNKIILSLMGDPSLGRKILESHGINTEALRIANEISPEWHVRMQAAWAKNVSNSVSKTCNLPSTATIEDVEQVYLLAHKLKCKGITIYRSGSREKEVLVSTNSSNGHNVQPLTNTEIVVSTDDITYFRPKTLSGDNTKILTGHGNMYVNVNFDNGNPVEVFANIGKAGKCDNASTEAIGRLISLALQNGISSSAIAHQLKGITCCPTWDNGTSNKSPADAIAIVLDGPKTPPSRRLPFNTDAALEILNRGPSNNGSIPKLSQSNKSYNDCPECGDLLIAGEGCYNCIGCGYSRCS